MKILWFAVTPSMYDEPERGGWVVSLEKIIRKYYPTLELAIAFEYDACKELFMKEQRGNVTYYPFKTLKGWKQKMRVKFDFDYNWKILYPIMLNIINDYKPDIIQCFGSEWPFGMIAKYVNIPVVIHMQGFLNIINLSESMVYTKLDDLRARHFSPQSIYWFFYKDKKIEYKNKFEVEVMKHNRYFIGRTKWDKELVKYFSPNAKYFYCSEAIRPEIYESEGCWKYREKEKVHLVTISQAGPVKGNEIILRTAKILKEVFNYSFVWYVTGDKKIFKNFEKKVKIKHEDVGVVLLGMIDATSVTKELLDAHLYIHPAIIDNSPNSLCEAQIVGCPVIAANVGGISSMLEDEKTGFLYPYNEPYALAFKIMNLMENTNILEEVSQREICIAKKRHEPQMIGNELMKIYESILNERI